MTDGGRRGFTAREFASSASPPKRVRTELDGVLGFIARTALERRTG